MNRTSPGRITELRTQARESLGLALESRYPMEIRYAQSLGWLLIRDPFSGGWHEVYAKDCPSSWRRAAHAEKQARKLGMA